MREPAYLLVEIIDVRLDAVDPLVHRVEPCRPQRPLERSLRRTQGGREPAQADESPVLHGIYAFDASRFQFAGVGFVLDAVNELASLETRAPAQING